MTETTKENFNPLISRKNVVTENIINEVESLYSHFPYPHYPILAKPLCQEGLLSFTPLINDLLHANKGIYLEKNKNTTDYLVAGCGEIQPYVIRKLEASNVNTHFVDLSNKSLQRAKLRLLFNYQTKNFFCSDISSFLISQQKKYHHIEAYGLLHHLPNPSLTLDLFSQNMHPGSSMRLMVYNKDARQWITHTQKLLSLLKLNIRNDHSIKNAQTVLEKIAKVSPNLEKKLQQVGVHCLKNKTRFVDTFLHCREARLDIKHWFHSFTDSHLSLFSLFDRYAELDDLENPLWHPPKLEILHKKSKHAQFQNNFELYLYKNNIEIKNTSPAYKNYLKTIEISPWFYKYSPPRFWFSYKETKQVKIEDRWKLWWAWIKYFRVNKYSHELLYQFEEKYGLECLQRLARIGAILPNMLKDMRLKEKLSQAITAEEKPDSRTINSIELSPFSSEIKKIIFPFLEGKQEKKRKSFSTMSS